MVGDLLADVVELPFEFWLFGEGVEIGGGLCLMDVFGETVHPIERRVLCVDVRALVFNAFTKVEDVIKQGRAKGDDEQVGDDHFPARPPFDGIFVLALF